MTRTPFDQAFEIVVGHEGGYDATHADPGNWTGGAVGVGAIRGTNYGISAASYPDLDIAALTLAAAQAIYRRDYWDRIVGDALPPPVALLVFDAAVNNGVERAVKWLQQSVDATPDGKLGPATHDAISAAVTKIGVTGLATEFQARRVAFMGALPTWETFGLGWARRLCALPYQSLSMTTEQQTT